VKSMLVDFALYLSEFFERLVFVCMDYCDQLLASMLEAVFPGFHRSSSSE
jgi:hypothetical protein